MQDDPASAWPAGAGRRRVTQLTKEEWRVALQQQMMEQEQKKKTTHTSRDETECEQHAQPDLAPLNNQTGDSIRDEEVATWPGRRGVARAMTTEEWRAALEQQIREKEEQRKRQCGVSTETSRDPETKPPSTPQKKNTDSQSKVHGGMTNDEENDGGFARRHRVVLQQSREEYLKSLEEQIEQKKRQEQDAADEAERASRARRLLMRARRRKSDDSEEVEHRAADTMRVTTKTESQLKEATQESSLNQPPMLGEQSEVNHESTPPHQSENQQSSDCAPPMTELQTTTSPPAAAVDAAALAKLVELCEGMKQQNEELKQQLREQQSVLASLTTKAETKIIASPKPTNAKIDRRSKGAPETATLVDATRKSSSKKLETTKSRESGISKRVKAPAQQTDASHCVSPCRIGTNDQLRIVSAPPADRERLTAGRSRLPRPKIIPRLRSAQSVLTRPPTIVNQQDSETLANERPVAMPFHCTASGNSTENLTSPLVDTLDNGEPWVDVETPPHQPGMAEEIELEAESHHSTLEENGLPSTSSSISLLPRIEAPTSCQERLSSRSKRQSVRKAPDSLPRLVFPRSSAMSQSANTGFSLISSHKSPDNGSLDTLCSSSVAVLDGPSAMVPCTSRLSCLF